MEQSPSWEANQVCSVHTYLLNLTILLLMYDTC